jgi:deoxyribodipyrimidine photo-lyase
VVPSAAGVTTPKLPFIPEGFNASRARLLTKTSSLNPAGKCVVLWMSRDQRADDNWALAYAQGIARAREVPLKVVFNLVPKFEQATLRQYSFMLSGLEECEQKLRQANVPFFLLMGDSVTNVPKFAQDNDACAVVTDFQALRVPRAWIAGVATALDGSVTNKIPLVQVDAHNIVPCWVASPKLEYSGAVLFA